MLESENTLAIVMPSANANEAALVGLEKAAVDAIGNAVKCINVQPGATITYVSGGCYVLPITAGELTEYTITSPQPTQSIAVFTKHPAEIEVKQNGIEVKASGQLCNSSWPEPIAGYVPGSDVYQHNKIDLDQKAMEAALKPDKNFTLANDWYSNGGNSWSNDTYRAPACRRLPPRRGHATARGPGHLGCAASGRGRPHHAPTPRGRSFYTVPGTASVRICGHCCRFAWVSRSPTHLARP